MRDVDWVGDHCECIDPTDGGPPIVYWWDDMEQDAVRQLVVDAYERGRKRGFREACEQKKSEKEAK